MTINEVFEKAIKEIQTAGMYKGQFYSPEGVVAIIKDIQKNVVGNNVIGVVSDNEHTLPTITQDMRDKLVELIDDQIQSGLDNLDHSDIIDESSLEVSINGSQARIDNISIDTDNVHSEITWHTSSTVEDWLNEYGIEVSDR